MGISESGIIWHVTLVSGYFHPAWCFQGSSVLWDGSCLPSALWLNTVSLHICATICFSIHLDGHLGCFYLWAVVNSAAMDILVYALLENTLNAC